VTNAPLQSAVTWSPPWDPSTYWYVDNIGNPPNNPFYDPIGTANATDFLDAASREYSFDTWWRAYTFIATGDLAARTLSISNQAVYWGFDDPIEYAAAPAPNALVLFGLGSSVLMLAYARRGIPDRAGSPTS
jgi:hypothetical protein